MPVNRTDAIVNFEIIIGLRKMSSSNVPAHVVNAKKLVDTATCFGFGIDIDWLYDKFSGNTFSRLHIECQETEVHLTHFFFVDEDHPKNTLWICTGDTVVLIPKTGTYRIYNSFDNARQAFINAITY